MAMIMAGESLQIGKNTMSIPMVFNPLLMNGFVYTLNRSGGGESNPVLQFRNLVLNLLPN